MPKMMEEFLNSRLTKYLQKSGTYIAGNRYLIAISAGLMTTMSLMLIGAIFQIMASPPVTNEMLAEGGIVAAILGPWYRLATMYKDILLVPYNMTMGLISVVTAFAIAYQLAKSFDMKPLISGVVSMVIFLMVAAPAKTVILEDGKSTFTGLDVTSLGGVGIFTAIFVAIFTVKVYKFCQDKKIGIRMPAAVPPFLSDSFSALVPLMFNVLLFHGLNSLLIQIANTPMPIFIAGILSIPFSAIDSFGGMMLLCFFTMVLWSLGVQGTMVSYIAIMPLYMQVILNNGALVAAGQEAVYHPVLLFGMFSTAGGTGNLLAMILMGLRSKSQQIKVVSKAAIIPSIFGISEPAVFGYPLIYNPILAIPFIVCPMILTAAGHIAYTLKLIKPPFVLLLTPMPPGIQDVLSTMNGWNFIVPYVGVAIAFLVYYPFYKAYEIQLSAREREAVASIKERE
jgi:PTS system cellobiose-specific IIC component